MSPLNKLFNHKKITKPVFIVGCGRSGTTILFDVLSQHPGMSRTTGYPDGEDHDGWIKHGGCVMAGFGNVHSGRFGNGINGFHACLHMTAEDVTSETTEKMHSYYWDDVLKRDESQRVINKCPHNSNKLGYMLKIFPDAKIIHMVRDCEPVVASWIVAIKSLPSPMVYWPEEEYPCMWLFSPPESEAEKSLIAQHKRFFPGGGAELFIDYWVKTNEGIKKQMTEKQISEQLLTLRYEDFTGNPEKELSKLTEFCELSVFSFDVSKITPNQSTKHQNCITTNIKKRIRQVAASALRDFGYAG